MRLLAVVLVAMAAAGAEPAVRTIEVRSGAGYDTLVDSGRVAAKPAIPDPFDPRWEAELRRQVRAARSDSFDAWGVRQGPPPPDLHRYVYSTHCAAALRKFLEQRYGGSIDSLNKTWSGERYGSFEEILERRPEPVDGPMLEDYRDFSRELMRRLHEITTRVIREEDPKHPIR